MKAKLAQGPRNEEKRNCPPKLAPERAKRMNQPLWDEHEINRIIAQFRWKLDYLREIP
jgi:hypothetical protein